MYMYLYIYIYMYMEVSKVMGVAPYHPVVMTMIFRLP